MKILFTFFFSFFLSTIIVAQELVEEKIPKRIYTTKRLKKVPVIDGLIDDDAWSEVEWFSNFL